MKTRKLFLVFLAIAGILTGCSRDEAVEQINNGSEISFRLQGGTPSNVLRATATTNETIDAFVVWGTDNVFGATNELIFSGVTIARKVGGTPGSPTFEYAPKRYFGEGATNAGFFAISPASAKITPPVLLNFMTAGASFGYTVPAPNASGNTIQEDLLVATTGPIAPASPVSLDFYHALSRIFVTATNNAADPVIIHSLTLKNLYNTGTLNVSPAGTWGWTPTGTKVDYDYVLAETGVVVPPDGTIITPRLVTSMEQGMLILPQITANPSDDNVFDTGDFALEVVYTFANLVNQPKFILIEDGFPFLFNTQYKININFSVGAVIDFTIDVKPFVDGIDPEVY